MWNDTDDMLYRMGYGPEREKEKLISDLNMAATVAKGAAIGYGVSRLFKSWGERRAANAQAQEQQNAKEAREAQKYAEWRNAQIAKKNRAQVDGLRQRLDISKPVTK